MLRLGLVKMQSIFEKDGCRSQSEFHVLRSLVSFFRSRHCSSQGGHVPAPRAYQHGHFMSLFRSLRPAGEWRHAQVTTPSDWRPPPSR